MQTSLIDWSPAISLMLTGLLLAAGPLAWVLLRKRSSGPLARFHAIAVLTLFLTFDLVMFGAFTRLTDSGLGCPDWPGCYGQSTPAAAHADIAAAQAQQPTGPVTHGKAWIEMVHRYLATAVGVLIIVLTALAWRLRSPIQQHKLSPWLPCGILIWVCLQGAFGALTVTMKLFPAIVSMHLIGGYTLLALLVWQVIRAGQAHGAYKPIIEISRITWVAICAALALLVFQVASGAWVSTNYAVLACTEFPQCQGQWLPEMNLQGFELWRPLGTNAAGEPISYQAITAIHWLHRSLAMVTATLLGLLAWHCSQTPALKQQSRALAVLIGLQLLTGLTNVVLGWPLLGAVMHTGGAGAMIAVLIWMLASTRPQEQNVRDTKQQRDARPMQPEYSE
jgi:cytochrome c oxidase assembly protein subunit 15